MKPSDVIKNCKTNIFFAHFDSNIYTLTNSFTVSSSVGVSVYTFTLREFSSLVYASLSSISKELPTFNSPNTVESSRKKHKSEAKVCN